MVDVYDKRTGLTIDRREVALHAAAQRLAELGGEQKAPTWFLANVVEWHDYMQSHSELRL